MATNPAMLIRIAADLKELRKNLAEGKQTIETTTAAMGKLAASLSGDKLIQSAHNITAAVHQLGGAAKLTEAEKARLNATLTKALEKYQLLGREAPPAMVALANATAQVPPKLSLMEQLAGAAKSSFTQLFGAFTLANVATGLIQKLGAGLMEFAKQGSKLPAIRESFDRLTAGLKQNGTEMLQSMGTATKGLVSNFDLMTSANKAMLLGLPVTTQSMGELAKTATILGKAMGQDATKSLDDLITALGRSSPMILDNLGLTVKVGEANEAYAAKLGKSADALTDAEKKMAFYDAAMEAARRKTAELGEQTRTLGEIATSAWTSIGNVVTESAATANVGIGRAMSSMREFATFAQDVITQGTAIAILNASLRAELDKKPATPKTATESPLAFVQALVNLQREAQSLRTQALAPLTTMQRELVIAFDKGGLSAEKIAEKLNAVKLTAGVTAEQITRLLNAQKDGAKKAEEQAEATRKYQEGLTKAAQFLRDSNLIEYHKLFSRELEINQKQLDASGKAWAEYTDALRRYDVMMEQTLAIQNRDGIPTGIGKQLPMPTIPKVDLKGFAGIFGSAQEFGKLISGSILAAVQGGGNVFDAAGGAIGTKLGTSIGGKLGKFFTKDGAGMFSKALGGMFESVLPVIGSLMGPLLGKIGSAIMGLFKREGRDLVKEFAASMGGFDALREKMNVLGDEGERLWIRLTQGIDQNSPAQAKAAIEAIGEALDKSLAARAERAGFKTTEQLEKIADAAVKLWKNMRDSGKYSAETVEAAWEQAHQALLAAGDSQAGQLQKSLDTAKEALKALDDQIASIQKSIENEAPEEVMGVIEAQARARLEALKKERDAAAQHVLEVQDQLTQSLDRVAAAIERIPSDIEIRVRTQIDGDRVAGPYPQAHGGDYWVTKPTLFLAGEAGPERATFSGAGGSGRETAVGDVYVYIGNEQINAHIDRVARRQLATGTWRPRVAAGRSY